MPGSPRKRARREAAKKKTKRANKTTRTAPASEEEASAPPDAPMGDAGRARAERVERGESPDGAGGKADKGHKRRGRRRFRVEDYLPEPDALEAMIRKGVESARRNPYEKLLRADLPAGAREDVEAFGRMCVAHDLEVMFLTMGVEGMALKHGRWIERYAPEVALIGGMAMFGLTQIRLNRAARELITKWRPTEDNPASS